MTVAHIIARASGQNVTEAYVEGTTLTAICGTSFTPAHDPSQFPVCEGCITTLSRVAVRDSN